MFDCGVRSPNLLFPGGQGQNVSLDPTSVSTKWHLNPSNDLSSEHDCYRRQTTDRQTTPRTNVSLQMESLALKRFRLIMTKQQLTA